MKYALLSWPNLNTAHAGVRTYWVDNIGRIVIGSKEQMENVARGAWEVVPYTRGGEEAATVDFEVFLREVDVSD